MITLHDAINDTRKLVIFFVLGIVGLIVLTILVNVLGNVKNALFPPKEPPPTVAFGNLPHISFPQSKAKAVFTYSVNTVTGFLPTFVDKVSIYKIQQSQPSLLGLSNAQTLVAGVGYVGTPMQISDTVYSWTNTDPLVKTLTMNIQTQNFAISSDYMHDQTILAAQSLPNQTNAITLATAFLSNLQLFPPDIDASKSAVSLFTISDGQRIPATSLSVANIVRVDLFQQAVNTLPIYYSNPPYSSMSILLGSSGTTNAQIVGANFTHNTLSSVFATYPIKTTQQAFQDLKDGNSYIASYDGDSPQITIRNVSLGYYMSDSPQQYLMPIFIFQGDNNFVAYVSALTDVWLSK